MAECPKCKSTEVTEIGPNRYECPYCGTVFNGGYTKPTPTNPESSPEKGRDISVAVLLCIFFPLLGIILYFIEKNKHPEEAKGYLITSMIALPFMLILAAILS